MTVTSLTLVLCSFAVGGLAQTFNKNYMGVAFSPYVKDWENGAVPYFNSYSVEDIKVMLGLVADKFSSVSTYGMGVADYNNGQPWDKGDSNCLIARAAAQINKDMGKKALSVNQGVYQLSDALQQREIDNAFLAIDDANSLFGQTVWGITFTNEFVTDQASGEKVLSMIKNNKEKAHQKGLKIGTRIHVCGEIYGGNLQNIVKQITNEADYILCNVYPANKDSTYGAEVAVQAVGGYFLYLRDGFRAENPNIEVIIGETGWPDQGHSFNDSPNTIDNLKNYWIEMDKWATTNQVKVQMFEAFDEPWKSDQNNFDPNNPGGKYGAEGHYGWWRRTSNNANSYVEKVSGKQV